MTPAAPVEKEEAPLSYEEAVQIAKDAGMSSSDIARCQRLAALSQDEFEAELVQIEPVTSEYDVPLMVVRGFSSETFAYNAAEAMIETGRPCFVYYAGQHR